MSDTNPWKTHCSREECKAVVWNSKFDHIRAGEEGWFFERGGQAWCPDDVPAWVEEWRKKKHGG